MNQDTNNTIMDTCELRINVTEMHCGGGPIRIVQGSELPPIIGKTLLEKRNYFKTNLDHLRRFILYEPRGHADLYGLILAEPDTSEAVAGLILVHNEGYGSMCGHGALALARYAVDCGLAKDPASPETTLTFQFPCGLIDVSLEVKDGKSGMSRFRSVPSYISHEDHKVFVSGYGGLVVDICFGGAYFAILDAAQVDLDVRNSPIRDLVHAGDAITKALKCETDIQHPIHEDLSFLVGTMFTDGRDDFSEDETAMICVFADKQVERSPCGSGCAARIAQLFYRGKLQLGQGRKISGPAGDCFISKALHENNDPYNGLVVEISGQSYFTGFTSLVLEDGDEIGKGFLLK